jgi:hypothetical protein
MMSFIVAAAFVLMILSPCVVAMYNTPSAE